MLKDLKKNKKKSKIMPFNLGLLANWLGLLGKTYTQPLFTPNLAQNLFFIMTLSLTK